MRVLRSRYRATASRSSCSCNCNCAVNRAGSAGMTASRTLPREAPLTRMPSSDSATTSARVSSPFATRSLIVRPRSSRASTAKPNRVCSTATAANGRVVAPVPASTSSQGTLLTMPQVVAGPGSGTHALSATVERATSSRSVSRNCGHRRAWTRMRSSTSSAYSNARLATSSPSAPAMCGRRSAVRSFWRS